MYWEGARRKAAETQTLDFWEQEILQHRKAVTARAIHFSLSLK
jgi:hypothetical protein